MTMRRAVDAKFQINGALFAVQEFSQDDVAQLLEVSNTGGICGNPNYGPSPGFASRLPDLRSGRFMLRQATFDDANNPFAAGGLNLSAGQFAAVKGFPAGLAGVSWNMGNVAIGQMSINGHVPGAEPVTIQGETDGSYTTPG